MNIVFFSHPSFLEHKSMPRFTRMLADGMKSRGHNVVVWAPRAILSMISLPTSLRKWLRYFDQYIIFPIHVKRRLKYIARDTLFVFTDQALGPWVPLVYDRPHVIHCHDFLAQYSALNVIPENLVSWTGKQYQSFIRRGYSKGKNFISVSQKTQSDLHHFLYCSPNMSEVVYNGLNHKFKPCKFLKARHFLGAKFEKSLLQGYLLHVGGNQWYKNRLGVVEIYNAWRALEREKLPLMLLGDAPSASLLQAISQSQFREDIYLINNADDDTVRLAYAGASVFLYPSLAEGFGWPIAEAMASGCPVITTYEAPMTEVAGEAALFIPRRPLEQMNRKIWASEAAIIVDKAINERNKLIEAGLQNVKRFSAEKALNKIETLYLNILQTY